MKLPAANPQPGTPYADIDDWRNRALLESNGIDLSDEAALVGALTSRDEQLRPVAAAALGVVGGNAAIAPLTAAARSGDDHLAAAAAAALARLGDAHGIEILRDLVQHPVSTSVVPFLTDAAVPLLEDFLAGTPTDWLAAEARRMLAEQRS